MMDHKQIGGQKTGRKSLNRKEELCRLQLSQNRPFKTEGTRRIAWAIVILGTYIAGGDPKRDGCR